MCPDGGCIPSGAYAQDKTSAPTHVSVGGVRSANVASMALNPSAGEIKSRQWEGGVATLDVPLSGVLSIDARAMWNRKGARLPVAGTSAFQDALLARGIEGREITSNIRTRSHELTLWSRVKGTQVTYPSAT